MLTPPISGWFQAARADTVVAIAARDGLATAVDVALVTVGVSVVVLALAMLWLVARLHRSIGEIRGALQQNMGPVSDRARSISDNVDFITQALRTDVTRLNASVKALTDRLHQASDHMEERVAEFNALMEVVQEEAEDIFLDTAATVRGVREGARTATGARVARPPLPEALPHQDGDTPALEGSAEPPPAEAGEER